MDDFLLKFFPVVYTKKHRAKENNYCKYDNQLLQLFTSSLYLAAVVCCFFASKCCKKFGRKPTMQLAAFFFFIGVILDAAAMNLPMLIVGRLCLGAGVGFGNQVLIDCDINHIIYMYLYVMSFSSDLKLFSTTSGCILWLHSDFFFLICFSDSCILCGYH